MFCVRASTAIDLLSQGKKFILVKKKSYVKWKSMQLIWKKAVKVWWSHTWPFVHHIVNCNEVPFKSLYERISRYDFFSFFLLIFVLHLNKLYYCDSKMQANFKEIHSSIPLTEIPKPVINFDVLLKILVVLCRRWADRWISLFVCDDHGSIFALYGFEEYLWYLPCKFCTMRNNHSHKHHTIMTVFLCNSLLLLPPYFDSSRKLNVSSFFSRMFNAHTSEHLQCSTSKWEMLRRL